MKKLFTALIVFLLPSFVLSQSAELAVKGTIPVICANLEEFASTLEQFNENPFITALSSRDMGDGVLQPTAMVIFYNNETRTFTVAEKIGDYFCVIAVGENMQPYFDENSIRTKM